jgi:phenylpropionate dioxygenase-like ring-hydroxylating dioxygenase large terminal subunit
MHIYVFSLLKYKIYLYLYNYVEEYLYYVTVKFRMQIYICIALLKIALTGYDLFCVPRWYILWLFPSLALSQINLKDSRRASWWVSGVKEHLPAFVLTPVIQQRSTVRVRACDHLPKRRYDASSYVVEFIHACTDTPCALQHSSSLQFPE